jgi:hypothetical protein
MFREEHYAALAPGPPAPSRTEGYAADRLPARMPSIDRNSSAENCRFLSAATLSSTCETLLVPTRALVTPRIAQHPGDRHLSQRLSAPVGDVVQGAHLGQHGLADIFLLQEKIAGSPRIRGNAFQIAV